MKDIAKYIVFVLIVASSLLPIPLYAASLIAGFLLCINGIFFIKGFVRVLAVILGIVAFIGAYCAFKGDPSYIFHW